MRAFESVCKYLHKATAKILLQIPKILQDDATEIVLRRNSALYIICPESLFFIGEYGDYSRICDERAHIVNAEEIETAVLRACGYSVYAHIKELANGYISLQNGCRMAVSSAGCNFDNALVELSQIECVRIRIAKDKRTDISFLLQDGKISSLLLVGPPASGKTTMLRNISKGLSDGTYGYNRVCIIDERNEMFPKGIKRPPCADVLSGMDKAAAVNRAVRLCSPEIIVCDEIGLYREACSILDALNSGVKFICSMHAANIDELLRRDCFRVLLNNHVFDNIVFLEGAISPGAVKRVMKTKEIIDEIGFYDRNQFVSGSYSTH